MVLPNTYHGMCDIIGKKRNRHTQMERQRDRDGEIKRVITPIHGSRNLREVVVPVPGMSISV